MTKNTFIVKIDPETNRKYVTKNIDELTKNHRADDKEMVSAMMPEQPARPFCPVRSFENKIYFKLRPVCNSLWQRPLESIMENDDVWYWNSPVDRDMLTKFMKKLSASCGFSQICAKSLHTCNRCNTFADARSITAH